jgi:anti-sigma factor RsiW
VEVYLAAHPAAEAQAQADIEQRNLLRARLAFKAQEPIPSRLRVANIMAEQSREPRLPWASIAAAVVWLGIGIGVGAGGMAWYGHLVAAPAPVAGLAASDAITAYRTYVGERLHAVEVPAEQEAHLVQWLSRRVGKPLLAPNLTAEGFRLMGGRLLPAGDEPAALFMYDDGRGNRLTLYARSGRTADTTSFRFENQDGVSAFSWIDNGLSYVVTGRVDRERLLAVAEAAYRQFDAQPQPPAGGKL